MTKKAKTSKDKGRNGANLGFKDKLWAAADSIFWMPREAGA